MADRNSTRRPATGPDEIRSFTPPEPRTSVPIHGAEDMILQYPGMTLETARTLLGEADQAARQGPGTDARGVCQGGPGPDHAGRGPRPAVQGHQAGRWDVPGHRDRRGRTARTRGGAMIRAGRLQAARHAGEAGLRLRQLQVAEALREREDQAVTEVIGAERCGLHGHDECTRCMPPDVYYRWQVTHDLVSIFYLPDYWARGRSRS
jgi:hypothetical protein